MKLVSCNRKFYLNNLLINVQDKFESRTVVKMTFWVVMPCRLVDRHVLEKMLSLYSGLKMAALRTKLKLKITKLHRSLIFILAGVRT
jgi:hypothetical protein